MALKVIVNVNEKVGECIENFKSMKMFLGKKIRLKTFRI